MARGGDPLCQENGVVFGHLPAPGSDDLEQTLLLRHLVENGFLEFKQWRGVATRYAKRTASYLAICQLRAVMIWSKLF